MHESEFFLDFFGEREIYFRCINSRGGRPIDYNGYYNQHAIKVLQQANQQNYEVYFVVNSGGGKDSLINQINAVFIDLDKGRDEHNQYYPLEDVNEYKQFKLDQLKDFNAIPSYINETRNGLQVFWLLNSGATKEQFKECEDKLISYFSADTQVKNLARLMRVPDYYWCKDTENKFLAKIVERNEVRYNIQDIIKCLPEIKKADVCANDKKKCNTLLSIVDAPIPNYKYSHKDIIYKNVERIQQNRQTKFFHTHEEVYDFLKKQDLAEFLGVSGNTFNCIFHEDKTPSAGIVVNEETGHQIYNCLSSNCGFKGTIIECTKRIIGCDNINALRFLRKVYKIEYYETNWQKEKMQILLRNQEVILDGELKSDYPELFARIRSYTMEILEIIKFSQENISTENFATIEGEPVFFVGIRYFASKVGKDAKTVMTRLGLLVYLGLLRKLREDQVPPFLIKKAKHEAAKKKQKNITNFYTIPEYTTGVLELAEMKAKEFIEKSFSMRGWSREMLLRALGEEEADRVFPQQKGKPLSIVSEEITQHLEKVALSLIAQKGWTTEKEVIESTVLQIKSEKRIKEVQFKRMIGEFLDKYGLVKKKLNKQLKIELGITDSGYFNVIMEEK